MTTLQTFFRAVVMLATLGLLAKAWYHFGPTMDEMKSIGSRVSEVVSREWVNYWQSPSPSSTLAGGPQQFPTAPAPFTSPGIEPPPIQPQHLPGSSAQSAPVQWAGGATPPSAPALSDTPGAHVTLPAPSSALVPMEMPALSSEGRIPQLLERLTSLGVRDHELKPWGSGGRLYRFSCSAPLVRSPSFSRHFEAVAESPDAAVEKVTAEIEAWRVQQ